MTRRTKETLTQVQPRLNVAELAYVDKLCEAHGRIARTAILVLLLQIEMRRNPKARPLVNLDSPTEPAAPAPASPQPCNPAP